MKYFLSSLLYFIISLFCIGCYSQVSENKGVRHGPHGDLFLKSIHFLEGSDSLDIKSKAILDEIKLILNKLNDQDSSSLSIKIVGYCDSKENGMDRKKLALNRAIRVVGYLGLGDSKRVVIKEESDKMLIDCYKVNCDSTARSKNRIVGIYPTYESDKSETDFFDN